MRTYDRARLWDLPRGLLILPWSPLPCLPLPSKWAKKIAAHLGLHILYHINFSLLRNAARLVVPEQHRLGLPRFQVHDLLGVLRQQVAGRGLDLLDDIIAGLQAVDADQAVRAGHKAALHDLAVGLAQLEHCIGHGQAGLSILFPDVQGGLAVVAEDQEDGLGLADPDLKGLGRAVDQVAVRSLDFTDHIAAGLQAIQGGVAVGAGDQVGVDDAAAGSGDGETI